MKYVKDLLGMYKHLSLQKTIICSIAILMLSTFVVYAKKTSNPNTRPEENQIIITEVYLNNFFDCDAGTDPEIIIVGENFLIGPATPEVTLGEFGNITANCGVPTDTMITCDVGPGGADLALMAADYLLTVSIADSQSQNDEYDLTIPDPNGGTAPGTIAFFDTSVVGTLCPDCWMPFTGAEGRAIVGTPAGGTNAGTQGTAMTDLENRRHTHDVDPAAADTTVAGSHTHTGMTTDTTTITTFSFDADDDFQASTTDVHSHNIVTDPGGVHSHSVDVANTTSTTQYVSSPDLGLNEDMMPYIQLQSCIKIDAVQGDNS